MAKDRHPREIAKDTPEEGEALGPEELDAEGSELGADPADVGVGSIVASRPTETLSGIGLAAAIYGFATQAGVDQVIAALIAIAIAFTPLVVSNTVDAIKRKP